MSGSKIAKEPPPRGTTRVEDPEEFCLRASPKRVGRALALLTRTYHGSPVLVHWHGGNPNFREPRLSGVAGVGMLQVEGYTERYFPHFSCNVCCSSEMKREADHHILLAILFMVMTTIPAGRIWLGRRLRRGRLRLRRSWLGWTGGGRSRWIARRRSHAT